MRVLDAHTGRPFVLLTSLTPPSRQGAIGVAVRIMELEAPPPDDPLILEESGATEPPTSARVVGAFRMRVEEIVSSFPFATAIVSPFSDEPPADEAQHRQTEKLEAEVSPDQVCMRGGPPGDRSSMR